MRFCFERLINDSAKELGQVINLAIEYDAGTEHASFFARTKITQYGMLFAQAGQRITDFKVLTFARSIKRVVNLMRQAIRRDPPLHLFYFALIDQVAQRGWETKEVFLDPDAFFFALKQAGQVEVIEKEFSGKIIPKHELISLPAASPRRVLLREDSENADRLNY